jgi:nucleoside-diphosphate-sugar epimerase
MTILLTGAAGRLGSATFHELLASGFEVRATDVSRRPDLPGKVRIADLLNREVCYDLAEDIDVLVHVANHPHAGAGTAQMVFNENVSMNMNIFQAAMDCGVKKILYASSIQAMVGSRMPDSGNNKSDLPYLPLDGNLPQHPGNPYALSKCVGENQLQYFVAQRKLPSAVAVRFPLLMGKNRFAEWRSHQQVPPRINPHTLLDEGFTWLSTPDAARLLVACVKSELPGYRCYFPAHPRPRLLYTPQEIIEKFFIGTPLKRPIDQITSMADITSITAETGWTPQDNFWE